MPDEPKPAAERSYQMGNIGAGARVAQGENISWVEGMASLPDGESLTRQFDALLKRIAEDRSLDEDTRALAQEKTKAIAEGIAITCLLRMVQASATAAAEQPCVAPIRASVGSRSRLAPGPPSGE